MKTVVYKVYLDRRNKLKQFEKEVVDEFDDLGSALILLSKLRMSNTEENVRYAIGHIK